MNAITIEALGLTKDELTERIVRRAVDEMLSRTVVGYDEDGDDVVDEVPTQLANQIKAMVKDRIDAKITEIAEGHVLPRVSEYVENAVLQKTNAWGEKIGEPITFVEYMTQRADEYMRETVNYDGKSKKEAGDYSFNGKQSRVTHLIERHLHHSIETGVKNALQSVNTTIGAALAETVKLKLQEAAASLKVKTEIGR